ncbi:MAG: hypothetical protein OSB16_04345 [Planktomarina sp.]|jgi:hypothetical protein|nr:hypothetical protein [Planktomarina sp.]MDT2056806.1 hypothetical protein [Planktomarina sp.]MDT2072730.1 hypothetical protein [Planktomarina sp.]MDT2076922.1 hypothetical protein [Planktomarina sp.]HAJ83253.1 hypothetical protein [Paracoccaceae bacterium]
MNKMDKFLTQLRSVLLRGAESMGLVLVVLILVYLLLGEESGEYVISVITNISLFVSAVTPQAIVGAAIVLGLVSYLRSK